MTADFAISVMSDVSEGRVESKAGAPPLLLDPNICDEAATTTRAAKTRERCDRAFFITVEPSPQKGLGPLWWPTYRLFSSAVATLLNSATSRKREDHLAEFASSGEAFVGEGSIADVKGRTHWHTDGTALK